MHPRVSLEIKVWNIFNIILAWLHTHTSVDSKIKIQSFQKKPANLFFGQNYKGKWAIFNSLIKFFVLPITLELTPFIQSFFLRVILSFPYLSVVTNSGHILIQAKMVKIVKINIIATFK